MPNSLWHTKWVRLETLHKYGTNSSDLLMSLSRQNVQINQ